MKKLSILLSVLAFSAIANAAAVINWGAYNPQTQEVKLSLSYGGGCEEHNFKLELAGGCFETFPVQCGLELVRTSGHFDMCEAIITREYDLSLPEYLFTDEYFERAFLTVRGANESSFSFQLAE